MKNLTTLFLILITGFAAVAQEDSDLHVKMHLGKVNLLSPGIEYEGALGDFTTLDLSANIGFQVTTLEIVDEVEFFVRPNLELQIRHYYNYYNRERKGKNTKNNSANFIALYSTYMFGPFNQPDNPFFKTGPLFVIGPVWGISRTYASGLALSLIVGAGYFNERYDIEELNDSYASVIADFKLGFAIGRDK